MKKLTYLLLALLIFACSSDDSSDDSSDGNQLFLEKYDSIFFEAEWATSDNTYKIAFVNSTNVTTYEYYNGIDNCDSFPIEGTYDQGDGYSLTTSILGETENSLTMSRALFYEGELENTSFDVWTVSYDGVVYKLEINGDENPPYLSTDDELCF